jgi:hypothetical protein
MSLFTLKAEGGTHAADRPEIRRALSLLIAPGDRHELRGLPGGRHLIAAGDDLDAAVEAACTLSDGQVYYSLNPLKPGADRANKGNVARRAHVLVDVDTQPHDASATDAEKAASLEIALAVADYLTDLAWAAPIVVDSGNGWHLLYAVDIPNDQLSQALVKAVLTHLAERFDGPAAKVGREVHDAPRIAKLPGTMARKGTATDERPHRMCRIAYEPESVELVTAEQLQALVTVHPATNGTGHTPTFATRATETSKAGYVRSAVERECYRVALAPGGERNGQLNKSAFALGQFADWPEADEREIRATLRRAAERAGLAEREILLTIASGWTAGKASPRPRPVDPHAATAKAPGSGRRTIRANEVKPETVEWIWPNVLALNFVNLFAGRTGIGKSFIMCDVAARLSRGLPMPDGTPTKSPANTLFISEDPYQYVLVPRLMELGADLDRVGFMRWDSLADYTLGDVDMLEESWLETDRPRLVVIDPPANYLGGKDEHKNAEVRSVLKLLTGWVESRPAAISMITHFNKAGGKGLEAIYRFMGSVAWGTTARIACGCETDPNDPTRCIFGVVKSNIGPLGQALGYRIEPTESLAKLTWLGPVDTSIDDAINKVKGTVSESIEAWMEDRFREKRTWPQTELKDLAMQNSFSFNAFKNYKKGVHKKNEFDEDGKSTGWWWRAVPGWPPEIQSECAESSECVDVSPRRVIKIKHSGVKRRRPNVGQKPECVSTVGPEGVKAQSGDKVGGPNVGAECSSGVTPQGVSETHSEHSGVSDSSRVGADAGAREGDRPIDERFPKPEGWQRDWKVFDGTNKGGDDAGDGERDERG